MADVLTQSEIDELLSALNTGEMDAVAMQGQDREPRIRVYDFKRALRISKEQIRSLSRIHENYARLLTSYFSARLRTFVQISVASVDQLPYEEFIRSIPDSTLLSIFQSPPLEGSMIMEVSPSLAYAMIDRIMGGKGFGGSKTSFTEIEVLILERLLGQSLDTFGDAWRTVVELEPTLSTMEFNPQFLQLASPNDTVIVISFSVMVGETNGRMNLCIPHVALEPVMPLLTTSYWFSQQRRKERPENLETMQQHIYHTKVLLSVQLGETNVSVSELLNLSVGDVITLEQHIDAPLLGKVDREVKFLAKPGTLGGRMGVQVVEILAEEGADYE